LKIVMAFDWKSFNWRSLLSRSKMHRARHFQRRERFRSDYDILARSLLSRLEFESILDVGCANGFLLSCFQAAGKEVAGIELSPDVVKVLPPELLPVVKIGDFSTASGSWDLVCCVEVAEHIPPEQSEELVAALTSTARHRLYFTAAPPGQGGRGHINCRKHGEWLEWFRAAGWELQEEETRHLRQDLEALAEAHWLRGNSMILAPT
jgi:SAM-dependent methyltransferase